MAPKESFFKAIRSRTYQSKDSNAVTHGWDSDSSTNYVVMSVRRKQEEELKVAGQNWRYESTGTQPRAGLIAYRLFPVYFRVTKTYLRDL